MSFLYLNDISPSSFRFENNDVFCRREQRLSIVWKSNRFRVKECDQIAARRDAPMGILFFRANSNGAAFNQIFECSKRRNFIDAIFSFSLSLFLFPSFAFYSSSRFALGLEGQKRKRFFKVAGHFRFKSVFPQEGLM